MGQQGCAYMVCMGGCKDAGCRFLSPSRHIRDLLWERYHESLFADFTGEDEAWGRQRRSGLKWWIP